MFMQFPKNIKHDKINKEYETSRQKLYSQKESEILEFTTESNKISYFQKNEVNK
jgi:hypothetical protein